MAEIYGTFGPSCCERAVLEAMLAEGLTGMRLNLSHTSLRESGSRIENYRAACAAMGRPMELMIDLHGPQQRTGWMKKPLRLTEDENVILRARGGTDEAPVIKVPPAVLGALQEGDSIRFHDQGVCLEVVRELDPVRPKELTGSMENGVDMEEQEAPPAEIPPASEDPDRYRRFWCRVTRGDVVRSQQTIRIDGKEVYGEVVHHLDEENLDLAADYGVTSVMQPFVRGGEDILAVREALRMRKLDSLRIFAKIETMEGVANLDSIIREADVIVIARGDLGNAMPLWELPRVQKEIAARCRDAGRPFLTVTQMLDSMTHRPTPTRAEVSDIFNAILDGSAAVMVTGETAVGEYPAEVIRYLARTVEEAEAYSCRSAARDLKDMGCL